MDSGQQQQLEGLQAVMAEVLSSGTKLERKREIEASLAEFKRQAGSWMQCCTFMQYTSEPNVLWYCASVLEYTVSTIWGTISEPQKAQMRAFLLEYYQQCATEVPAFVQIKVAKVYADVGKQDWPHAFPSFFESIYQLLQESATTEKGLSLLRIAMEECTSTKGVLAARAAELKGSVMAQVPAVLTYLTQHLETTFVAAVTEAQRRAQEARLPTNLSVPSTPRNSPNMFAGPVAPEPSDMGLDSFMKFGAEVESKACKALDCILQLFTWINLSEMVTPGLMDVLYSYAQLTDPDNAGIGSLALACFNEMLANHCVPGNFGEYLFKLFQHTMQLLDKLTTADAAGKTAMQDLSTEYNQKFTEFLELFITSHLQRVESDARFPINEFLTCLFKFTFLQEAADGFVDCLSVCNMFLEVLAMKFESQGLQAIAVYQPNLMMLTSELVNKLRFANNAEELMQLDNVSRNEDQLTEWEEHLRDCMETVGHVSQLYPAEVMGIALPLFVADSQKYVHVHECLTAGADGKPILTFSTAETQQAVYVVSRDMATMTQVIGRLAGYFTDSLHTARFSESLGLVQNLVDTLQYGESNKLYTIDGPFTDVHIQTIFTLKLFGSWFSSCCRAARETPEEHAKFNAMVLSTVSCSWQLVINPPTVEPTLTQVLLGAAADLLATTAMVVRPQQLLQSPQLDHIVTNQAAFMSQPAALRATLCSASVHALLLPWHDMREADQNWELREAKFAQLFGALFGALPAMAQQISEDVEPLCNLLAAVTRSLGQHGKKSKEIFMKGLSSLLPAILQMFQAYAPYPGPMSAILDLVLAMFESVATMLPAEFVNQAMQRFLHYFSKEQMQKLAVPGAESANQSRILEIFFAVLKLLVQSRSAVFRQFLGDIISICVDAVYTLAGSASVGVDIKMALFDVVTYIMLDKWKYFFPIGQVQQAAGSGPAAGQVQHEEQFLAFIQAFGVSFAQLELELFRANLQAIIAINSQKKLFERQVFREKLYAGFVETLFNVICAKTHALFEDEIFQVLFSLSTVDPAAFYQWALAGFLAKVEALSDPQRAQLIGRLEHVADLPTFTKQMREFCDDISYVQQQSSASA